MTTLPLPPTTSASSKTYCGLTFSETQMDLSVVEGPLGPLLPILLHATVSQTSPTTGRYR